MSQELEQLEAFEARMALRRRRVAALFSVIQSDLRRPLLIWALGLVSSICLLVAGAYVKGSVEQGTAPSHDEQDLGASSGPGSSQLRLPEPRLQRVSAPRAAL